MKQTMVTIITRDTNGKRIPISIAWGQVCSYVEAHADELDETEILAIFVDSTCIYSQLANGPIDWEDITGFFG